MTSVDVAAEPRPRPVFCITADAYRDRARADDVRAGRFTELGLTLELGTEPDWHGAQLPADVEWRIAWSKFYFGLDLAHAFAQTGDAGYLRTWEGLVRSWMEQVPAGHDKADVTARRVQNWVYAWDAFAAAPAYPGLTPGLADAVVAGLGAQLAHIRANLTPARNHRTLELYALLVVALALPELDPGGELRDFSLTALRDNLLAEVRADGVHIEASTHYHLIVLRSFVGARENARRHGLELPEGYDEHLARALRFALHCHRPDGGIPALSDSDSGSYLDVLALAGDLLDDAGETAVSFPDGGYFVQRSGWAGADERHLIFDCGPLGAGGHGHYDLLSFEAAARGRALLVDPGRYTYSELPERPGDPPNPRHWFKGTAAHNTVCVDGTDQTPYARSKPAGPVAQGRFVERVTGGGVDLLHGEAYSPCYDAVHARRILFVAGEYWIVEDELRAATPHRYDVRFHLAAEAEGRTFRDGRTVRAPGLALVFAAPLAPVLEDGWVAPLYGVKHPAPVVSAAVDGVAEARLLTLVAPVAAGEPAPALRVLGAGTVEVRRAAGTDTVAWGPGWTSFTREDAR